MILYSIEAESSVLGEIISNPHLIDDATAILNEGDFYQSNHKVIFSKLKFLKQNQMGIDPITLSAQNSSAISIEYVAQLMTSRSFDLFLDHIQIIKSFGLKRKLLDDSRLVIERIQNENDISSNELIAITQKNNNDLLDFAVGKQDTIKSYKDILPGYLERLKTRALSVSGITGLETGYRDLDNITAGLQRNDLIIVAARPSMGKTTFAMNLVEAVCVKGKRAMVFSMEMPKEDLLDRTFASIGGINQGNLKRGNLSPLEQADFLRAMSIIESMDLLIDDEASLTISKLRARAIKAHRESPLSLIMIDYIQLMSGEGSETNRTNIISDISRGLKALAKELEIPVIALSQLNRSLEQRQDKRPINSDLRESGAIEQDADIIVFVYRDEVYNPDTIDKNVAEIIIGKHRNGSLGTVRLGFEGAKSRFVNQSSDAPRDVEFKQPLELDKAASKSRTITEENHNPAFEDDSIPFELGETLL